jgi:hypothetical protein
MQKRLEWLNNFGYIENSSVRRTRTTLFLMPLIGISETKIMEHHPKMFINAHIKNIIDKEVVVVLNKLDFTEESITFILLQNLNENFIECIEDDEEYLLYYKIPQHFYEDFDKIIEGKYSKTSDGYKSVILNIYGVERNTKDHKPYMHDCLYPDDIKRKLYANYLNVDVNLIDEVSSRPRLKEYELFKTINQLNENYEL